MSDLKRLEELNRQYAKQLKDFKKDESYFKDYEGMQVKKDYLLVRFMVVQEKKKSSIITMDHMKNEYTTEGIRIPTNVAKVISSGVDWIESGDIVTFPFSETAATIENPEMAAYEQARTAKGAMPLEPYDKRLRIGALEYTQKRKMVVRPGNIVPDGDDLFTYAFGEHEIQLHLPKDKF